MSAQNAGVGEILTNDGSTITLYSNAKKGKRIGRMQKDCDCQLSKGNLFMYFGQDGKLAKYSQGKIKKVSLKKGTALCREYDTDMAAGMALLGDLGIRIPQDAEMFGLPFKKNGGPRALQDILYRSDKYILTMYTSMDLNSSIYIFTADNYEYVTGRYNYMEVGYGGAGKKALAEIKKYFGDCSDMIQTIESTLEKNKSQKGRGKSFALDGIRGGNCSK